MLKKTICLGLALMMMGTSVFAADFYTVNPPSAGIFGTPTSVTTVVVGNNVNKAAVDLSKNSALIPPAFGSHTSNVRNTGEPLTPNLASPYVDSATGTTIVGSITSTTTQPSVTVSTNTNPNTGTNIITSNGNGVYIPGTMYEDDDYYYFEEPAFTEVTSSMKYTGGHIGTLKIPELDLSVKIYDGTTNSVLAKGVGHFKDTSIWNGNVCLAAHNRGTNDYFGEIHELDYGNVINIVNCDGKFADRKWYEVKTTEEFLATLDKLKGSKSIDVQFENNREVIKPKREPKNVRLRNSGKRCYVLKLDSERSSYFCSFRKNNITFCGNPSYEFVRTFETEKAALKYLEKYKDRLSRYRFVPVPLDEVV